MGLKINFKFEILGILVQNPHIQQAFFFVQNPNIQQTFFFQIPIFTMREVPIPHLTPPPTQAPTHLPPTPTHPAPTEL